MARIQPFRGWRPRPEVCAKVASPPYDVLSSVEAREMASDNPLSFLHVVKPEIDLDPGIDVYSPEVYAKGAANLRKLMDDGVLFREAGPALYLYRQRMGDHVQTGLVAGASVDEYEADLIKKHEHTRPVKEDDRTRHIDTLNANTGPVFLTYKARPEIDRLVERLTAAEPTYDFVAPDGIQHVMWVVDDAADRDALVEAFAGVPELYVADGHHRSAAGTRIRALRRDANPGHTGEEPYNYFLSVIFPDNQMKILDYNRLVKDLNGLDPSAVDRKSEGALRSRDGGDGHPEGSRTFGMYLDGSGTDCARRPRASRKTTRSTASTWRSCRTICSLRCSASAIPARTSASISWVASAGSANSRNG